MQMEIGQEDKKMSSPSTGLEGSSSGPYGWSYTGDGSDKPWVWRGHQGDPHNGERTPYPGYPCFEPLLKKLKQEGKLPWLTRELG